MHGAKPQRAEITSPVKCRLINHTTQPSKPQLPSTKSFDSPSHNAASMTNSININFPFPRTHPRACKNTVVFHPSHPPPALGRRSDFLRIMFPRRRQMHSDRRTSRLWLWLQQLRTPVDWMQLNLCQLPSLDHPTCETKSTVLFEWGFGTATNRRACR